MSAVRLTSSDGLTETDGRHYKQAMARFVVLYHETPAHSARGAHYDVMCEWGGVLRTWAIDAPPVPERASRALRLADHRLAYLDYQGPISGDRGHVTRWDRGELTMTRDEPNCFEAHVRGERLRGVLRFDGCALPEEREEKSWTLHYQPEEAAE